MCSIYLGKEHKHKGIDLNFIYTIFPLFILAITNGYDLFIQ